MDRFPADLRVQRNDVFELLWKHRPAPRNFDQLLQSRCYGRVVLHGNVGPAEGGEARDFVRIIGDPSVQLAPVDTAIPSPPSPLRPDVFSAIDASVKAPWGTLPIVPKMETQASDGLYVRNAGVPVYGVTGIFVAVNDNREHGKDERILVSSFQDGLRFAYELIKRLGNQ